MHDLIGRKIVDVRGLTPRELENEGWHGNENVVCIVLDDGTKLFPSGDEEGNYGGVLFGSRNSAQFYVLPEHR